MNPLQWIREKLSLTEESARKWGRTFGYSTYSGRPMSLQSTLQLDAAWRCVRLKSSLIGTFPLNVHSSEFDVATGHPLQLLLHDKPNAEFTSPRLWQSTVAALDLWGNAILERKRGFQDSLVALDWLPPEDVVPNITRRESDGKLIYPFNDRIAKRRRVLNEDEVVHLRSFSMGGPVGLSAVQFGARSMGIARDAEESAGRIFANGIRMSGWFETPHVLDEDQRNDFRENVAQPMQGVESTGAWGLLEGGFKWNPIQMDPEDAQLLESRRLGTETVCRWFDTPPIMVGHAARGQTMWGTGVQATILQYLFSPIVPLCVDIEKQLGNDLLTPAERAEGMFIRFNNAGILRGTLQEQAEYLTSLVRGTIMKPNEARARLNLRPEDGGDVLLAQQQMVPITQLGAIARGPQPQPNQNPQPNPAQNVVPINRGAK